MNELNVWTLWTPNSFKSEAFVTTPGNDCVRNTARAASRSNTLIISSSPSLVEKKKKKISSTEIAWSLFLLSSHQYRVLLFLK